MDVGMIGLGRMGANMSRRWLHDGHRVVGYARHAETVDGLKADGAISAGAISLKDLVDQLPAPRIVWLMVPAGSVDATLAELVPLLSKGDVIIVPAGQPHQFAEVSNPFLHLTVKPIKAP